MGRWGTKEDLSGQSCGDPNNWNDRTFPIITSDTTIKHCFGSCETDGSCPAPPAAFIDITFTLNVSSITSAGGSIDPTGMFIAGGGNFGNPGDNPMTDLGGGVWSITVNKPIGFTSDYTFTNGNSGWGARKIFLVFLVQFLLIVIEFSACIFRYNDTTLFCNM